MLGQPTISESCSTRKLCPSTPRLSFLAKGFRWRVWGGGPGAWDAGSEVGVLRWWLVMGASGGGCDLEGGGGGGWDKENVPNPALKFGDEEKNNIKFISSISIPWPHVNMSYTIKTHDKLYFISIVEKVIIFCGSNAIDSHASTPS